MAEKVAVAVRDEVMEIFVVAEFASLTPAPTHELKTYPVFGVATIVGVSP